MPSNTHDVVITGLGPVSPAGVGCEAFWRGLGSGHRNVAIRTLPVDLGRFLDLPIAGHPPVARRDMDRHFNFLAEQGCEDSRDLAYSLQAIELALADAGFDPDRRHNRVGMVQAYEAPGVERTATKLFQLFSEPPRGGPPPVYDLLAPSFYNMQAFLYVHVVAKAFGLRGFCTSVHNACSSGAFAIEVAAGQIRSGQADVMIVVGGEAFETAVRLEWFRRLNLYAENAGAMRPFAPDSTGFYVGEGAAALVLESAEHAARRGFKGCARYLGGAFAHQAWKQTIPDVRGAVLSGVVTEALERTGVRPESIDLVVPHGAATQLSDGYEAACLTSALGERIESCQTAAFKHVVGHTLATSAIMDTLCALLALKNQSVPDFCKLPEPNLLESSTPDGRNAGLEVLLKTSTGFTGHDAALVFRREH